MRRFWIALVTVFVVGLLAECAYAQTVTTTPTATWSMPNNSLADAGTFTYKFKDNALPVSTITAVTCAVAPAPDKVVCTGTLAATPSAGSGMWFVVASSPDGTLQAVSVAKTGTMPDKPSNIKVSVTITFTP